MNLTCQIQGCGRALGEPSVKNAEVMNGLWKIMSLFVHCHFQGHWKWCLFFSVCWIAMEVWEMWMLETRIGQRKLSWLFSCFPWEFRVVSSTTAVTCWSLNHSQQIAWYPQVSTLIMRSKSANQQHQKAFSTCFQNSWQIVGTGLGCPYLQNPPNILAFDLSLRLYPYVFAKLFPSIPYSWFHILPYTTLSPWGQRFACFCISTQCLLRLLSVGSHWFKWPTCSKQGLIINVG